MRLFLTFLLLLNGISLRAESCRLLITGCGRSGSNYMAYVLERSGYDIKHEQFGKDGCVSWPMAVNSYSPWGPPSKENFEIIFHQTRHPLAVINSWLVNLSDLRRDEWVFIRKNVPEISATDSPLISAAKYWYYWNLLAEKKAEWRYQIEQLTDILPEFSMRSGIRVNVVELQKISKRYNSWAKIPAKLTWRELQQELPDDLYENIQSMALRYGYTITD